MISGYHEQIADHYEKHPYPSYPIYAAGPWSQLKSVDLTQWGILGPIRDCWIAGSGTIAPLMFARRNPHVAFRATDFSASALRSLRRRLRIYGVHNVCLAREDILETRYDEAFDAIDCFGVIHHTFSPQLALTRLAQALRVGGVLRLMVYSQAGRGRLEALRSEVRQKGLKDLGLIQKFLTEQKIERSGDLTNSAGIADALLNPIVHTYDEPNFRNLLASVPRLQVLDLKEEGNFVAFLRKTA